MTGRNKWKLLIYWVAFLAICLAVFGWGCGFTLRPTIVLSLFFSIMLLEVSPPRPGRLDIVKWTPFSIRFEPAFAEMMVDVGLLKDPNEWENILKERQSTPAPHQDFERNAYFPCFVLSSESEHASQLIAWPAWNSFRSELELEVRLNSLVLGKPTRPEEYVFRWSPDFFIRLGNDACYDFGLRVSEEWWKTQCEKAGRSEHIIEEKQCDHDWACGTIHLIMGKLPYWKMFQIYYFRDIALMSRFSGPTEQRKRAEKLSAFGWTIEDQSGSDFSSPELLVHKYMKIHHNGV